METNRSLFGFGPRTEGRLPGFDGATGWLNSPPLRADDLAGKVVLVDFWTYTCINWLRTLGYVRAWHEKYRDQGLVVVGVHTPEFPFERDVDNVRWAAEHMRVEYPIALDSDYGVWRAFDNHYWPAVYIADAEGRIRHHHFGEGGYEECERVIQLLLREAGGDDIADDLVSVADEGFEAQADWATLPTKIRTWVLVAGLTALLIGIGALIGGMFLYVFVVFAVALNVVGYWFSDRLALKASRAKPVEPGAIPELEAMVQDLAQRARVPVPRLYTIASEQPNAFATGRNPEHAAVAVTEGLLQQLPPEQVKSVLAHEGHIKNRDILVASIAATVAGAIAAIGIVLQFSLFFGGDDEDSGALGWIGLIGTIIFAPLAASLLQLAVSRQREFLADATRAELVGRGSPLADALETLERRAQTVPLDVNPATASLYIVNPLRRQGVATLFSTHPSVAERVRRLRTLGGDQTFRVVAERVAGV